MWGFPGRTGDGLVDLEGRSAPRARRTRKQVRSQNGEKAMRKMEWKRNGRKGTAVVLTVILAASALAGCGGSETSAPASGTESTAAESAQAEAGAGEESTAAESAQTEAGAAGESTAAESAQAEAGAGEESTQAEAGEEIPLDAFAGTTLTIARVKPEMDYSEDTNDKMICQMAEEATGIHVEWIDIDTTSAAEKVSVILASGDLPDVFLGLITENIISNDPELFYDLSEEGLLATYAPNAVADTNASYSNGMEVITWPDGSIRSLPGGYTSNRGNDAFCMFWINQVWLDQLGMDIPTTTDELHDVLCAFRDNDMDGDGDPGNEIPMTFADSRWAREFSNTANFFGIGGQDVGYMGIYYMLKDGKVTPTADTEQWRAWLEWGHQMVEEGLIDVEGFSQSVEQYNAKVGKGLVGVYPAFTPIELSENKLDWSLMWPVSGIGEGAELVKTGHLGSPEADRFAFVVSADSPHVQAALHWWNYLNSSPEIKEIATDGVEPTGETYEYDGYTYPVIADIKTDPRYSSYNNTEISQTFGLAPVKALFRPEEKTPLGVSWDYEKGEAVLDEPCSASGRRTDLLDKMDSYLPKEYMPVRIVDPDRTLERTQIELELETYINNFVSTSVVNGISDETWETYVAGLEGVGYYDWIQWWQDYYDGK